MKPKPTSKPKPKPKPKPMYKVVAVALGLLSIAFWSETGANEAQRKFDGAAYAHWDTALSAAPSDTIWFGFKANNATVCVPATSSAVVTWYGRGVNLRSASSGLYGNTRAGLSSFKSAAFTPPVSTCYSYYGSPQCLGVIITGTWTGTVLVMADRIQ